ncbi:hypothetical protein [uncultured Cytophaga sp.]|uniref:hypothetical protein n=1 Tax=uncultured Cytophaga sp. TaxID=160238 RepID=UPI002601A00B|nr:hypothetical protein [uncultured Cytophaga sp.]
MKNEDRMVELLAEMVKNSDRSIEQQKELISEVKIMRKDISAMHKDIRKNNIMLAEHSRAIITLAENVDSFSAYDERISEIEKKVFKK